MSDELTPPSTSDVPADNSRIARATAGIGILTGLGFATGFVTKMILSRLLGTLPTNNAYNYVYRLTQDVFRSWEKLVRPSFLPALARERERVGEDDAWRFTNSLVNVQTILLVVITLALMILSRQVVTTFTNFRGESAALASRFLVLLAPSLLFLSLAVTGYMLLNSYKRFQLAAFGDHVFMKLVPFVALVFLYAVMGIRALILGIVVGGAAKLALYVWGLRDKLRHYRPQLTLRSPAMTALALLMLPLAAGVLVSFVRNRIEDTFLTEVLQGRAVTIVGYAKSPVDIPVQLFPAAMAIAIFPFISEYFAKKRHAELFTILGKGVRIIMLLFLPLTVGLMLLAHPVVDVAFGGGKFTPEDVLLTARTLQYYAAGYVFFALEILLLQFFYAAHDTWTPTATGVVTSTVQLLILAYMIALKGDDVTAFTAAYSASKALKVLMLVVLLVRVYPQAGLWLPMLRRTGRTLLKVALATAMTGMVIGVLSPVVAGWLRPALDNALLGVLQALLPAKWPLADAARMIVGLIHLTVVTGAGALVFAVGVHLLHVEEWHQALGWVKGKLRRR